MKKFEYKFHPISFNWNFIQESTPKKIIDELNKLGGEGWEVIDLGSLKYGWLLKREIPENK